MSKLTLAAADYARLMPLASGAVAPEGVELTLITGREGSWPDRAAILGRVMRDGALDGGEASMGQHLARMDRGDRSFVALPVFVLRNFTARDFYVRQDSPFHSPLDLMGRRLGLYSWGASGAIWYRHFLTWSGLDLGAVNWTVGEVDVPQIGRAGGPLPTHVQAAPAGRSLSELLLEGEIDVLGSPPRPTRYHPTKGPIRRLIADIRGTEARYFRDTGVYPPQHLVVLRRAVWERDRSLARRVTEAFQRNNAAFTAMISGFPYALPWQELEREATAAAMGEGWHDDGLEENRAVMEQFCATAFAAGLTSRLISVDEYFAEYLQSE